jgi:hypothetical protein
MDVDYGKFVKRMLATKKAEALGWLHGGSVESFRTVGEMATTAESVAYVQRLYDAGAVRVLAVKIDEWSDGQNTGHLLVQLASDVAARRRLFALEREQAEPMGFEGSADEGQEYLYFKLD